jgi:hypothetical protein
MIVCGLDMSILKNPKSAARSVVKYVKLGTAKATAPRTTRINPITMSGRIVKLLLVSNTPLAEHDGETARPILLHRTGHFLPSPASPIIAATPAEQSQQHDNQDN